MRRPMAEAGRIIYQCAALPGRRPQARNLQPMNCKQVVLLLVGLAGLAGCSSSPTDSAQAAKKGTADSPAAGQAVAASELRYAPTEAVRRAAIEEYARQQPGSTPAAVEQFVTMFGPGGQGDYGPLYTRLLERSGLHNDDVADAFAAYTVATYRVAHGEAPEGAFLPAGPSAAVRAQFAPLAAKMLVGQPAGTKARLGELMKLQAVLVYVGAQQPTPAFRQNVARKFLEQYKVNVNALTLTDKGLEGPGGASPLAAAEPSAAPTAASPATTSGNGVAAGARWFFRSVSNAYGGITFEPVALLANGQYCDVGEAPLESLDAAADQARRPAAWGRWRPAGNAIELTGYKGHTSSYTLGDGSWFPAYPAGATPLQRTYKNSSGGSVAGATSLVISELHFVDDSHFTEGADGGVVTANAAGGSRRSASGTYQLQGHTLSLTYTDGRTVHKSFAIGAEGSPARPSNTLIFIGGDAYTDE